MVRAILNAYLNANGLNASFLNPRKVLKIEPTKSGARVDWERSSRQTSEWLAGLTSDWAIITGFIASTPDGVATTLKRNGSDFSASIFGRLLATDEITIWTDVDGVLSADPGMKIHERAASEHAVKGFATIDGMALINVEGTGIIGVPKVAHQLFGALREVAKRKLNSRRPPWSAPFSPPSITIKSRPSGSRRIAASWPRSVIG